MCLSPLTGYHGFEKIDGKKVRKGLVFRREASFSGIPIKIPCGQCIECRKEDCRQWAMRALHEKKMHPYSQFLNLTYDNASLPPDWSLDHRHFQLFMKKLRKARGFEAENRIKYFMSGEYGEENRRPHYHAIVYNVCFPDKKLYGRNGAGDPLYSSRELSDLWGNGLAVFGEVTFQSCAYVAGYVLKKAKGSDAWRAYCDVDSDGLVTREVLPEYRKMSVGLGKSWFLKYGVHAYQHDSVIVNGKEVRPPKYYDKLYEAIDPAHMARIKRKRGRLAYAARPDNTTRRKRVKEVIALRRLHDLKRKL